MWLTGGMSGRADKTSNTYTKQASITGKTIAVTLRNPVTYDKQDEKVIMAQNKFHALAKGVATFYRRISAIGASAEDQELCKSIVATVRGQHRYATVRGYLMAKCAQVSSDLTKVKISYRDNEEIIPVEFKAREVVPSAPSEDWDNGEAEGENGSNGSSGSNGANGDSNGSNAGSNGSSTGSEQGSSTGSEQGGDNGGGDDQFGQD